MSDLIKLTSEEATQITDGTNNAHITVHSGGMLYADAADSEAWHFLYKPELNINAPVIVFAKARTEEAEIAVTKWAAS